MKVKSLVLFVVFCLSFSTSNAQKTDKDLLQDLFDGLIRGSEIGQKYNCKKLSRTEEEKYTQAMLAKIIRGTDSRGEIMSSVALISSDFCIDKARDRRLSSSRFSEQEFQKTAQVLRSGVDGYIESNFGDGKRGIDFIDTSIALYSLEKSLGWRNLLDFLDKYSGKNAKITNW